MSNVMNKICLNNCPHNNYDYVKVIDPLKFEKFISCSECDHRGPNLWLCLYRNCSYVGCSEQVKDHGTHHFKNHKDHCIHINLSSRRAWCYHCEKEVSVGYAIATEGLDIFSNTIGMFANKEDNDFASANSATGLVGLQNIANTCYMNSALQALSNLLPMTHYFLSCQDLVEHIIDEITPRTKVAGLAKSYQRLMKDMWENDDGRSFVAPRGILYGIRSVHPMFRGFHQHDTQEFLRCFMDQLHEELKEQSPSKEKDNSLRELRDGSSQSETSSYSSSSGLSDTEYESCESNLSLSMVEHKMKLTNLDSIKIKQQSDNEQSTDNEKFSSIISEIFDGKLLSSVQCLTCDRISTRVETFQDLSLPIPNRDYLNVLHQTYSPSMTSLNSLDGNSLRNHEGWLMWMWNVLRSWLWGPSVTLHDCMASFFSADELKGDNMYSCEKCKKLRTGIKYSRVLELPEVLCIHLKRFRHDLSYSSKISSHVIFPLENFEMRSYLDKNCTSTVSTYSLASVICHHGTVGGGHYTCLARNAITNRWYEYDDQHVTEVGTETVENCQAYVLFYQKQNPQMKFIRAKASELCLMNPLNQSDIKFYLSREWLSRFSTFAEPGPINNSVFLCPHGGILPSKSSIISQITVAISQQVWHYLYRKFGGGPAVNMLYECEICKKKAEALVRRQLFELNAFTKFNSYEDDIENGTIYAISMPWLRKWQKFAHGSSDKVPGPITNNDILPSENVANFPQLRSVRQGSDFAQINEPLWRFLYEIYGGGPEIILRGALVDHHQQMEPSEKQVPHHNEEENINHNSSDTESNIGQKTDKQEFRKSDSEHSNNEEESSDLEFIPPQNVHSTNSSNHSPLPNDRNSKNSENFTLHFNSKKRHRRNRFGDNLFGPKGNYKCKNSGSSNKTKHSISNSSDISEEAFENDINKAFPPRKKNIRLMEVNRIQTKDKTKKNDQAVLQKFALLPEWNSTKESEA